MSGPDWSWGSQDFSYGKAGGKGSGKGKGSYSSYNREVVPQTQPEKAKARTLVRGPDPERLFRGSPFVTEMIPVKGPVLIAGKGRKGEVLEGHGCAWVCLGKGKGGVEFWEDCYGEDMKTAWLPMVATMVALLLGLLAAYGVTGGRVLDMY